MLRISFGCKIACFVLILGTVFSKANADRLYQWGPTPPPSAVGLWHDPGSGLVRVVAGEDIAVTTFEVKSLGGYLTGFRFGSLGLFDVDTSSKIFRFDPAGFTELDIGYRPGLSLNEFIDDIEIDGSLLGGGSLRSAGGGGPYALTTAWAWGDVNFDGMLDAADLDILANNVGSNDLGLDLDRNGVVDLQDWLFWVRVLKGTWIGDSDLDGEFNSGDLVSIFQADEFEDGIPGNSGWVTGDWDGDGEFDTRDLVLAFQDGGFEQGFRYLVEEKLRINEDLRVGDHWFGDGNLDGEYNSLDFIDIFRAGEYEDEIAQNSSWATGDWNGDGEFDTRDLILAGQDGGFEQGPRGGVKTVPEPPNRIVFQMTGVALALAMMNRRRFTHRFSTEINDSKRSSFSQKAVLCMLALFIAENLSTNETYGSKLVSVRGTLRCDLSLEAPPNSVGVFYSPHDGSLALNTGDQFLTTIELKSASGLFQPEFAHDFFNGLFDVVTNEKMFKLDPGGFSGNIDLGRYSPGHSDTSFIADIEVDGSFAGGGNLLSRGGGGPYSLHHHGCQLGDFDNSLALDVADIDAMSVGIANDNLAFDLDGDGDADLWDRYVWVHDLRHTFFGDANFDDEFNSSDLVAVFSAGEYEVGIQMNSTWSTGDWNGDGEFDTRDFVLAGQDGGYEQGPRQPQAVPEPTVSLLITLGLAAVAIRNRRCSPHFSGSIVFVFDRCSADESRWRMNCRLTMS